MIAINQAAWEEHQRKLSVPQVVSRRQAKQALLLSGLFSNVQPAIDDIEDDTERQMVQIYWDDATVFERSNAQLVGLGKTLGLTEEQIDDLFIQASGL